MEFIVEPQMDIMPFALLALVSILAVALLASRNIFGLIAGLLVMVGGSILVFNMFPSEDASPVDTAASKQIYDTYGLKLTNSEMEGLQYPQLKTSPTEDFEVYGSISQIAKTDGDGYSKRDLYLIWDDGKMILAESENGEKFTPLTMTQ